MAHIILPILHSNPCVLLMPIFQTNFRPFRERVPPVRAVHGVCDQVQPHVQGQPDCAHARTGVSRRRRIRGVRRLTPDTEEKHFFSVS